MPPIGIILSTLGIPEQGLPIQGIDRAQKALNRPLRSKIHPEPRLKTTSYLQQRLQISQRLVHFDPLGLPMKINQYRQ